jgi:hypothetical protein
MTAISEIIDLSAESMDEKFGLFAPLPIHVVHVVRPITLTHHIPVNFSQVG